MILSGLPMLSLNLKRARTYAERMFRHVVVGNLARSDAWDALAIPLATSHRSFALSVVGGIVEGTAGYPYFLQFFGAYVCRSVASPDVSLPGPSVTVQDVLWAGDPGTTRIAHTLTLARHSDQVCSRHSRSMPSTGHRFRAPGSLQVSATLRAVALDG